MKALGIKSLALAVLTTLAGVLAFRDGKLTLDHLRDLSTHAGYAIGLFTVLVGTWFYRFWNFRRPSRAYLRLSRRRARWEGEQSLLHGKTYALLLGQGEAGGSTWDLSPAATRGLTLCLAFFVALTTFDARSVRAGLEAPGRLAHAGEQFCPPEKAEGEQSKPEVKPGCELMQRAFELGFVKNLGSCAPEEGKKKLELCGLRQLDEPYLHYMARLFTSRMDQAQAAWTGDGGAGLLARLRARFEGQLQHLQPLIDKHLDVVRSYPKSSHHVFTNLPHPEGALARFRAKWFRANDCMSKYRSLPHTIEVKADDPLGDSKVFEHVFGQLLFNPKYQEVAGQCQEYTVHWSSPADTCDRLARDPEAVLKSHGIQDSVHTLLRRLREQDVLHESQAAKGEGRASPDALISFQCFMREDVPTVISARMHRFEAIGHRFSAMEFRYPNDPNRRRIHVELYKYLSKALVQNFNYAAFSSNQGAGTAVAWQVGPEMLSSADYPLTRLEYLKGADVFLGSDWLQDRGDLLEVYPYYHHLYHFVEVFRDRYRLQRARL